MRWQAAQLLREAPEFRRLSYSRREVLAFLIRRADEDGVVRRLICVRVMAQKLDMPYETTRKALQYLSQHKVIACVPGRGRFRSRYAVPVSWGTAPLDPLTPAPVAPNAATASMTTTSAGQAPTTGQAAGSPGETRKVLAASGASADAGPWTQTTLSSASSAPTASDTTSPVSAAGSASASSDGPTSDPARWCELARARGFPHPNKRCCGTTARQLAAIRKSAAAAAARQRAEQEREAERQRLAALPSTVDPTYNSSKREWAKAEARRIAAELNPSRPVPEGQPP